MPRTATTTRPANRALARHPRPRARAGHDIPEFP
ncbi:hypothetical protein EDC50_2656 [Vulcaniibacterium tengchongense]|uniref:Uncharacterized protein n=1 Tax=Vulcaniibacterium tengchongense TaxID=1273429 RepID=A0A3N4UYG0_9GAMM|nr:hypothetical protein EDC50_2656 [Vulcaniibacterium tengchongense]